MSESPNLAHDEMRVYLDAKKWSNSQKQDTRLEDKHEQDKQLSFDQNFSLTLAPAKSNSCSTLPSQRITLLQVTSKNEEDPPPSLVAPPKPSTLPVERRWLCNDDNP